MRRRASYLAISTFAILGTGCIDAAGPARSEYVLGNGRLHMGVEEAGDSLKVFVDEPGFDATQAAIRVGAAVKCSTVLGSEVCVVGNGRRDGDFVRTQQGYVLSERRGPGDRWTFTFLPSRYATFGCTETSWASGTGVTDFGASDCHGGRDQSETWTIETRRGFFR